MLAGAGAGRDLLDASTGQQTQHPSTPPTRQLVSFGSFAGLEAVRLSVVLPSLARKPYG